MKHMPAKTLAILLLLLSSILICAQHALASTTEDSEDTPKNNIIESCKAALSAKSAAMSKVKSSGRVASRITEAELMAKIEKAALKAHPNFKDEPNMSWVLDNDLSKITPKIAKDLSKVQFEAENSSASHESIYNGHSRNLIGLHTLDNGLTFLGVHAGGDWEIPVFYIIYWDGKDLRGYIPTEGNTWNTDTKWAYGNADEMDEPENEDGVNKDVANAQRRFPNVEIEDGTIITNISVNEDQIKADLKARIIVR